MVIEAPSIVATMDHGTAFVHKPADIHLKPARTEVLIKHPDLIVQQATILFHRPVAVVAPFPKRRSHYNANNEPPKPFKAKTIPSKVSRANPQRPSHRFHIDHQHYIESEYKPDLLAARPLQKGSHKKHKKPNQLPNSPIYQKSQRDDYNEQQQAVHQEALEHMPQNVIQPRRLSKRKKSSLSKKPSHRLFRQESHDNMQQEMVDQESIDVDEPEPSTYAQPESFQDSQHQQHQVIHHETPEHTQQQSHKVFQTKSQSIYGRPRSTHQETIINRQPAQPTSIYAQQPDHFESPEPLAELKNQTPVWVHDGPIPSGEILEFDENDKNEYVVHDQMLDPEKIYLNAIYQHADKGADSVHPPLFAPNFEQ